MRNWKERILRRSGGISARRKKVATARSTIADAQLEFAGLWVALKDGKVVEARPTPYELTMALHERDITDTTIVRMPGTDEPELVGLG
jgi:hypothetical protein